MVLYEVFEELEMRRDVSMWYSNSIKICSRIHFYFFILKTVRNDKTKPLHERQY